MVSDKSQLTINNVEKALLSLPENIRDSKLTESCKLVLATLYYYADREANEDKEYSCYITNADLAEHCGLANGGLYWSIRTLVSQGLISRQKGKRGKATIYTLNQSQIESYENKSRKISPENKTQKNKSRKNDFGISGQNDDIMKTIEDMQQEIKSLRAEIELLKISPENKTQKIRPEKNTGLRATETETDIEKDKEGISDNIHSCSVMSYDNNINNINKNNINNTLTESTLQGVMVPISESRKKENGNVESDDTAHNDNTNETIEITDTDNTQHDVTPNDDNNISISNEMDLQGCDNADNDNASNNETDTTDQMQHFKNPHQQIDYWISLVTTFANIWERSTAENRESITNRVKSISTDAKLIRQSVANDEWSKLYSAMSRLKSEMELHTQPYVIPSINPVEDSATDNAETTDENDNINSISDETTVTEHTQSNVCENINTPQPPTDFKKRIAQTSTNGYLNELNKFIEEWPTANDKRREYAVNRLAEIQTNVKKFTKDGDLTNIQCAKIMKVADEFRTLTMTNADDIMF